MTILARPRLPMPAEDFEQRHVPEFLYLGPSGLDNAFCFDLCVYTNYLDMRLDVYILQLTWGGTVRMKNG